VPPVRFLGRIVRDGKTITAIARNGTWVSPDRWLAFKLNQDHPHQDNYKKWILHLTTWHYATLLATIKKTAYALRGIDSFRNFPSRRRIVNEWVPSFIPCSIRFA
jgi:hypothetical protein